MSAAATAILQPGQNRTASAGDAVKGTAAVQPGSGAGLLSSTTGGGSKLAEFEGFLKSAGHLAGVVLSQIVRYAIPLASIAAVADPAAAPAATAFASSLKLVQATVVTAQQRWAAEGSEANAQKLADVLEIVEQPIVTMFAQVGVRVDTAYVTNLVNGVVAILNAQPAPSIAS